MEYTNIHSVLTDKLFITYFLVHVNSDNQSQSPKTPKLIVSLGLYQVISQLAYIIMLIMAYVNNAWVIVRYSAGV